MGHFHDDAPKHSYTQTKREVRRHLGVPIERVFAHFPKHPVASGSVAQVYRAVLRPEVATACAARDPEFARRVAAEARRTRKREQDVLNAGRFFSARPRESAGTAAERSAAGSASGGARAARRRRWWISRRGGDAGFETNRSYGAVGESADALARAALAAGGLADGLSADAGAAADLSARTVAVKVRHPGVARQIFLDFQILKRAARALRRVPALRGLNLEETLGQFSHTMTSQTDLRVEARHLRRFGRNFRRATQVFAPWPVCGLATEGVLCETFERGEALSSAIRRGCEDNATTCALGVDTYLKMLLRDNFLHSDLHPGNILYHREADVLDVGDACDSVPDRAARARRAKARVDGVRLVLLDFGIADALPGDVRDRFLTFLFSLARQDGIAAANSLLTWSDAQTCVGADADGLREDIARLVDEKCALRAASVDMDAVLKQVLTILRARGVSIDAVFASLVVSMCVLVGFATALDENLNLFEVAISAFLSWSVTGDVAGKLYA
jgi:aarF domain-containing kinase